MKRNETASDLNDAGVLGDAPHTYGAKENNRAWARGGNSQKSNMFGVHNTTPTRVTTKHRNNAFTWKERKDAMQIAFCGSDYLQIQRQANK